MLQLFNVLMMGKFLQALIIAASLRSHDALSMSASTKSTTDGTTVRRVVKSKSAVIIGAGPVGLAASLMLEKCGWNDITIIEKRPISSFESTKAYLYLIDGRGRKITDILGDDNSLFCFDFYILFSVPASFCLCFHFNLIYDIPIS